MAGALASFAEGLAAEEDADTERALEAYRRSLALDPGNTELAVKVAFELARRGQVPEGIDLLKDAAKAAPKEALPPLCLSQIYGKFLKKNELAEKYALAALALDPDSFSPYLVLFDLYSTIGNAKKAEAILERAAKSSSPDPQFWLQLGEVVTRRALKSDGSISPEELARINPLFEKALAHGGGNLDVTAKVADFYILTKQVKPAIPLYRKAVEGSADPNDDDTLAIRDKLARCLLADSQRDEAVKVLEAMVKDAPARYETYELLGELYATAGQLDQAISRYQQALLIDSTQPKNFLRVADLQLQQKKTDEAVKTIMDARARFPGLPVLSYSLGVALTQAKQSDKAMTVFEEAVQEAGNSGEALDGRFYFNYGIAAEQAGQLEKSAQLLRKSIELDPNNAAVAYNYLGYMWADRGVHLEEAADLIKHALALDPDNGAYLDSLGWCYYKMGHYEEALVNLKRSVEQLQPGDAVVYEHLGDTYAAMNDMAQAVATWKKAIALDPENKSVAAKLDKAQHKMSAATAIAPVSLPPASPAPAASPAP